MIDLPLPVILLLALPLAFVLGFSAHRAGICTVNAVAEIFTTRRAHMLISFAKTALWVLLLTILVSLAAGDWPPRVERWALTPHAVIGGLIFGIGAAVNGGCIFSSLTKLADGRFGLLAGLLAMLAGAGLYDRVLAPRLAIPGPQAMQAPIANAALTGLLLAVVLLLLIWELRRLLRGSAGPRRLRQRVLAQSYRLSTAAALIGLCNALLILLIGSWFFAATAIRSVTGGSNTSLWLFWLVNAAALAGMVASTLQRRSFRPQRPKVGALLCHIGGGLLMGIGIVMTPGGNDSLLLHGIPALSPHALPAYLAILAGIALVFGTARLMGLSLPQVRCSGDVCRLSTGRPE